MNDLLEIIDIEFEKLAEIINKLPTEEELPFISELELAGVTAVWKTLKRILKFKMIDIPIGRSWHIDLLNLAISEKIISKDLMKTLTIYLGFRHYFTHAYAVDLYADRMKELVTNASGTFTHFKTGIDLFLKDNT